VRDIVDNIGDAVSDAVDDGAQDAGDTAGPIVDIASGAIMNFVEAVGGDTSSK